MDRSRPHHTVVVAALAMALHFAPGAGKLAAQEAREATEATAAEAVEPTSPAIAAADAAARTWLVLVDEEKFEQAWISASNTLQTTASPQKLKAALKDARSDLDSLGMRTLVGFRPVANPPGAAPGDYVILQYRLQGSPEWSALETVVPREEDGIWRVTAYAVKRE